MGFIRLILALSVILAHVPSLWGYKIVGGMIAVQCFFIISGFYIALILTEKYNFTGSYKLFISNRALKLFPAYLFILLASIVVSLLSYKITQNPLLLKNWFEHGRDLSLLQLFWVGLTQITILGQDILLFLNQNITAVELNTGQALNVKEGMYNYLIVPPSWTLSLEIMFYLIAPFFVALKTKKLIFIMILLILIRILGYQYGYNEDPWSYRFFGFELMFFVSGVLSYRLYRYIKEKNIQVDGLFLRYLQYIIMAILLIYNSIPTLLIADLDMNKWLLYLVIILSIPVIFLQTKSNKLNRYIGDLSYPIYISHMLIFILINGFNKILNLHLSNAVTALSVIIFTIIISLCMNYIMLNSIEKYRQSRIRKKNL